MSWPMAAAAIATGPFKPRLLTNSERRNAAASLFLEDDVFFLLSLPVEPPINTSSDEHGSNIQ